MRGHPTFAARLTKARSEKGISISELARQVGVTPSMISRYEACKIVPKLDSLVAIGQTLDCSLDYLCGLTEN